MAGDVRPPFWTFLDDKKRGNSDGFDRCELLDCLVETLGSECIDVLLGDREFVGDYWTDYLREKGINYVFRIRTKGCYIANSRGKTVKIEQLLRGLPCGEKTYLGKRKIGRNGDVHCVSALRNEKGELVVAMHSPEVENPLETYRKRWEIETMFKAFKSSGFDMESTHIVDFQRLNTLFTVMTFAFCISYKTGDKLDEFDPLPIKSHGKRASSVFRKGFFAVKSFIANPNRNNPKIAKIIRDICRYAYSNYFYENKIVL